MMIYNRSIRFYESAISSWLPAEPTLPEEWTVPADTVELYQQAIDRKWCLVDAVKLYPVEAEMITGIADCKGVKGDIRAGFILTPRGSLGQREEKAKDGEKVVMYIHGG